MVIEDEAELRDLIAEVIELEGHQAVGIGHPAAARNALRGVDPDLFLVDIMLPQTSGIELAEKLRADGYADTPMIGMSASKLMRNVAAQSGMFTDTMDKPFEMDDLLANIRRYMPSQRRA